jgi:hypothetical protein
VLFGLLDLIGVLRLLVLLYQSYRGCQGYYGMIATRVKQTCTEQWHCDRGNAVALTFSDGAGVGGSQQRVFF